MRSTSVKSIALTTAVLLFTVSLTAAPAKSRGKDPREKQETVITRFQKIAKSFVFKLTSQDT
ncbi:MAG: hypothetical protein ACTHQM_00545, partial [Thermoanaerobaculia bacterium]